MGVPRWTYGLIAAPAIVEVPASVAAVEVALAIARQGGVVNVDAVANGRRRNSWLGRGGCTGSSSTGGESLTPSASRRFCSSRRAIGPGGRVLHIEPRLALCRNGGGSSWGGNGIGALDKGRLVPTDSFGFGAACEGTDGLILKGIAAGEGAGIDGRITGAAVEAGWPNNGRGGTPERGGCAWITPGGGLGCD